MFTAGLRRALLQVGADHEVIQIGVPFDLQDVWFAANLTIFYVALLPSRAGIDGCGIPFTTACTLKS